MPRQRAAAILPPQHQLQRLQEWLRARLEADKAMPPARDRKARFRERLGSVEKTARKLASLLEDGPGLLALEELLRQGSDLRQRQLLELADACASIGRALKGREDEPPAAAALLFLHLLYRHGSRWPALSGVESEELLPRSPEVVAFHGVLRAAGHAVSLDRARDLLTDHRAEFVAARNDVPAIVLGWLECGEQSPRNPP
jgi:hypothetical protein